MKLNPLNKKSPNHKIKMIITESQLKILTQNVIQLQEQKEIINTILVKKLLKKCKEYINKD
jgi:hypothetical protein